MGKKSYILCITEILSMTHFYLIIYVIMYLVLQLLQIIKMNNIHLNQNKTKQYIQSKQKKEKVLSDSTQEEFDDEKKKHSSKTAQKEFCKKYIRRIKLLFKDKSEKIKSIRLTKKTKDNKTKQKSLEELCAICYDCIHMENEGEFNAVSDDTDCEMCIWSAQDVNVFDIQPNVYGISNSYCFCGDKYRGKDMVFCDQCKIWYHIVCLCIKKKEFEAILKKKNGEYICLRCHCKPH
eukprot:516632_1